MNKKKVLVVIGGQSTEHSVSRVSGSSVCRELNKDKYEMTICGIDLEGQWYILDNEIKDYSKGIDGLPLSDVLKFVIRNGWIAVRPSGTEPKIKFYFSVKAESRDEAVKYLSTLKETIFNYIK